MKLSKYLNIFIVTILVVQSCSTTDNTKSVYAVIERIVGEKSAKLFEFHLKIEADFETEYFDVMKQGEKIHVTGNSKIALCRGVYDYLSNGCNSIVSWSGNQINIPGKLPDYSNFDKTPYQFRFYMNSVTHGYSTPYWDWNRWEKEIDWMAVHGINMPYVAGAHEAILRRVFLKLGFTQSEIDEYFTGPAHFPWNRMGNITGWDGPPPANFYDKQIAINHKVLTRLQELGMYPIVQAFAGFVPKAISRLYPDEITRQLSWGGFDEKYQAAILEPGSDLFIKIGKMYIQEYEKEFGIMEYYLADSFNEMDVPLSKNPKIAAEELAGYGSAVFRSINEANSEATWVMQGWTFPYQKDKNGKLFWTPERLKAMLSDLPDDQLMILDLANEYNRLWWKSEPSWKMYNGFFGKKWIYSFIPNMGGKVPLNGRLDIYASIPIEALNYDKKQNLVGFGFAPEGIENNEIIYELLSDMGWAERAIDLEKWVVKYCKKRYGKCTPDMEKAYDDLLKSCFNSFTDHPRFRYQFRPSPNSRGSVHSSGEFFSGVEQFIACSDDFNNSKLYQYDAIELASQYFGLKVDQLINQYFQTNEKLYLKKAISLLYDVDKLLASHPNHRLEKWVNYANNYGDNDEEKQYYQSNAKRLITTWGGWVNEYSARTWSGLIRDYYIPRWEMYMEDDTVDFVIWEENWIQSTNMTTVEEFEEPMIKIKNLLSQLKENE